MRLSVEVAVAEAGTFGEDVGRLFPEFVISSQLKTGAALPFEALTDL